ncbi:MAG: N-acetyltransferase, partial [Pseudomonadota bacterium]|nr:N-acetyltransferase [Pseudomonadota bacterium]
MTISTSLKEFMIRDTTVDDCDLILNFIKELAEYERLSHEVTATRETLQETLFGENPHAEVLIGEFKRDPVAY